MRSYLADGCFSGTEPVAHFAINSRATFSSFITSPTAFSRYLRAESPFDARARKDIDHEGAIGINPDRRRLVGSNRGHATPDSCDWSSERFLGSLREGFIQIGSLQNFAMFQEPLRHFAAFWAIEITTEFLCRNCDYHLSVHSLL